MDIRIFVATHKRYWMPKNNIYVPIQLMRDNEDDLGYLKDNVGINISNKNKNYCELSALYWIWKNIDNCYVGLCHYRRYLGSYDVSDKLIDKQQAIMSEKEYERLLNEYDMILPYKVDFKKKTVKQQYAECHYIGDLFRVREVMNDLYPEYLPEFDYLMDRHHLYICNMFVTRKEILNEYANWLFAILEELEKRVDISNYDPYQSRLYGYIGERLFNVWLHKRSLKIKEVPMILLEKNTKISVRRFINYVFHKAQNLFF